MKVRQFLTYLLWRILKVNMALAIKWSVEARTTFEQVIEWIRYKWSEKEAQNFISKTENVIQLISYSRIYSVHQNIDLSEERLLLNKLH